MKKAFFILVVVAALVGAGAWAYQRFFAQQADPTPQREDAVVTRGSLDALVNATGTILPEKQTTLSFKGVGRVAEVLVQENQAVRSGDLLARLESADLEFAVAQAELALASTQAQLLRIQRPPAEYELAAAQAALDSSTASYQRLLAGPTEEERTVARANLDQAQAVRDQAQMAYNQVADRPDVGMLPQSLQLQQATIAYEAAKASFELATRPPSEAELAAARAAVAQARAALARLQAGVPEEELLLAHLQVEQAQLSLDQARHQLEGTTLTAPHDGQITRVGVKPGELTGGQPAFVLTDLSRYHIDVSVDEIDIGRVMPGQRLTVTLDALPGEVLGGWVEQVFDVAQLDSGVVTYQVRTGLDPTDAPLRLWMSANVDIVAERREGVLLVPNRFVRIDRTTGKAYVDRVVDGQIQPTEIQIGLRDELSSEVLAGLAEGELVVLLTESSRTQLRRAMEMGPP